MRLIDEKSILNSVLFYPKDKYLSFSILLFLALTRSLIPFLSLVDFVFKYHTILTYFFTVLLQTTRKLKYASHSGRQHRAIRRCLLFSLWSIHICCFPFDTHFDRNFLKVTFRVQFPSISLRKWTENHVCTISIRSYQRLPFNIFLWTKFNHEKYLVLFYFIYLIMELNYFEIFQLLSTFDNYDINKTFRNPIKTRKKNYPRQKYSQSISIQILFKLNCSQKTIILNYSLRFWIPVSIHATLYPNQYKNVRSTKFMAGIRCWNGDIQFFIYYFR